MMFTFIYSYILKLNVLWPRLLFSNFDTIKEAKNFIRYIKHCQRERLVEAAWVYNNFKYLWRNTVKWFLEVAQYFETQDVMFSERKKKKKPHTHTHKEDPMLSR